MTNNLVPVRRELLPDKTQDRRAALELLNQEAELAQSVGEAKDVMEKSRIIADALERMKAPKEETRAAARACVVAGRRLGRMLSEISGDARDPHPTRGAKPSLRTEVSNELGLSRITKSRLVRLAEVPDPDFQRYLQDTDIPSMTGCLVHFSLHTTSRHTKVASRRKKRAGVKNPANPSLDAAYSMIVKSLGHLDGIRLLGGKPRNRAVASAMNALYDAEDLLRPYCAGYGKQESA